MKTQGQYGTENIKFFDTRSPKKIEELRLSHLKILTNFLKIHRKKISTISVTVSTTRIKLQIKAVSFMLTLAEWALGHLRKIKQIIPINHI